MNDNIVLLGLKNRVAAISRSDGHELWRTEIAGGWGGGFVTLLCDESRIFACAGGHLTCLDLATGRVLWTNDLPGYGHGLASLCLPGGPSAPDPAIAARYQADQSAASGSAATAAG